MIGLFDAPLVAFNEPSKSPDPSIETPAGTIRFRTEVGRKEITQRPCDESCPLANGGRILRWGTDLYEVELLICRPMFSLPAGMRTDDCWAGMWRLKASRRVPTSHFNCEWSIIPGYLEGSPESGECLDAQTWQNERMRITIGTQDSDCLYSRAKAGDHLPIRWATDPILSSEKLRYQLIDYTERGLTVHTPDLLPGELCQVHFVIAWSIDDPKEVATWYAADRPAEEILKGMIA
jgi:hypothetical protein